MTTIEKIRAEIEQTADEEQKHDGKWAKGLRYAVKIIDKYAEQEPCADAVSRQAVLEKAIYVPIAKVMKDELLEYCEVICRKVVFVDDIEQLPSVRPQEQTGHWIKSRDCYGNYHFTCSKCGNDIATQYADNWEDKYCSDCGAKMVEPQERSDKE